MPSKISAERRLASAAAAHTSWANTDDRTARTAPARRALEGPSEIGEGGVGWGYEPSRAPGQLSHLRPTGLGTLGMYGLSVEGYRGPLQIEVNVMQTLSKCGKAGTQVEQWEKDFEAYARKSHAARYGLATRDQRLAALRRGAEAAPVIKR